MIADLDTLLTALYVELTDWIIPSSGSGRSGPGRPPEVTDAELVCLAVAQVLLRHDDERHWLRAAPKLIGHLFPRLLGQSEYNERLKNLAPLMEAALRWLAEATPGSAELLRLMDATPVPCGASAVTAKRSGLYGWAGVRVLPEPFPLVLGGQAADHLHLRRDGDRVRPGEPQALRGTRGSPPDAEGPAGKPAGARHRGRHGQGPVRRGDRGLLRQRRPGPDPDPPGPQGREANRGTSRTGCGSG